MAKRKLSSDINVVPYIDVMLVLLIIFMVTAPLLTQGIGVDLPDTSAESLSTQDDEVVLSVRKDGAYYLNIGENQKSPLSDEEVVQRIGAVVRNKPDRLILVHGDAAVPYERVAHGMALLQEAGARKVGFVTEPREEAPRR
ncbi:protein TolR [Fontimonas sp. SYSU GA230001]|uniref:protein TolR n=1 Tax=Fontimonas sp. SYSU GA230001 TaxID=3142450 RepID=UPI0032B4F7D2